MTTNNVVEFDMRGQICPSCLLIALKQVNQSQDDIKNNNMELHILSDDRQSTSTIPEAIKNMGYDIDVVKEQGWYRIKIFSNALS